MPPFNIGHIEGGTNAGWAKMKPKGKPWKCACADNPGYLKNCLGCGAQRPES